MIVGDYAMNINYIGENTHPLGGRTYLELISTSYSTRGCTSHILKQDFCYHFNTVQHLKF